MTPPEVSNGVYRYIFNHMPFVDQSQYQFCFLTKSADDLKKTPEYEKYRFPVYALNTVQRDGRDAFAKEIRSILSDGFDAVHLHTSSWRGFLIEEVAMDEGIKHVIVHSHSSGIDFVDVNERDKILKDHLYYKERFTMEYATDVCACSHIAADWLFSDKIPKDSVRIMPNAIDASKYRFSAAARERIRKALGAENRTIVGNVGRYSYTKNQEFLVKVFWQARKSRPDLFLVMIGQGENISQVKKLVGEMGLEDDVICYGWRDDIPDHLMAMDAFCLPSRFEGLPISVIEAQAAGLKCLVSDSVTSECDITGNVAFIPLDEQSWIDALINVSADPGRGDMSKVIDDAGYSLESSYIRLLELYQ